MSYSPPPPPGGTHAPPPLSCAAARRRPGSLAGIPLGTTATRTLGLLLLGSVVVTGCDRPLVDPDERSRADAAYASGFETQLTADGRSFPARPLPLAVLPGFQRDGPVASCDSLPPREVLERGVRETEGWVMIWLKPPSVPPACETGGSPSMVRSDVLAAHQVLEGQGVEIVQTSSTVPIVFARIAPEAAEAIRALPEVNALVPDAGAVRPFARVQSARGAVTGSKSDRAHAALAPGQDTTWAIHQVRAPDAWAINKGGNASITMIDSGVDQDHFQTGDGPARLSIGDCFYHGHPGSFSPTSCWDETPHGAGMAGFIAARDNEEGVIGIAHVDSPDPAAAKPFASIRVCDAVGWCWPHGIYKALEWTYANLRERQVINMSFGATQAEMANWNALPGNPHPHFGTWEDLLNFMVSANWAAGNLLIAAAGNGPGHSSGSDWIDWPARHPDVIAVSGTMENDNFAEYLDCHALNPLLPLSSKGGSFAGAEVELSAPYYGLSMWKDGQYAIYCGTSVSTAIVSGVAALVWTKYPNWSNSQVRQRLINSAVDLGIPGRSSWFGWGRVDAWAALQDPHLVEIAGPELIDTAGIYTWEAIPSGFDGPYSYQWYTEYVDDGSGDELDNQAEQQVQVQLNKGSFWISVEVWSSHGMAERTKFVTVSPGGGPW
jgi:hypothetical protein